MKRIVLSSAVVALAVAGMSTGSAAPALNKVTGGGQILVSAAEPGGGPGQTLAFNARQNAEGTTDNADGQLQYNAHDGATKFHGTVTCLVVTRPASDAEDDPDTAEDETKSLATLAGTYDNGTAEGGFFKLTIADNDEGGPQGDAEPLAFSTESNDDCGQRLEIDDLELGRGNIVIHKDKAENGGRKNG